MHNPEILKDKRGSADTRPTRPEKGGRLPSLLEAARIQREGLDTRVRWLGPAQGSKVVGRVAPGGSAKLSTSGLSCCFGKVGLDRPKGSDRDGIGASRGRDGLGRRGARPITTQVAYGV
jgi:hypothetical protein